MPEDAPFFVKDYHDYYKTARGYHKRSLNSNEGWNVTSSLSFMNARILAYSSEIRSAVLMIQGERRIRAISAATLLRSSQAATRSFTSSPARCTRICTTGRI